MERVDALIDRAVLDHFQEGGAGWQDRINDALRQLVLKPAAGKQPSDEQEALPGTRRRLSDWLATRLVQFDAPVHLFLDEFQSLNNRGVLTVFRDLLERIPENVTIFIGSRALPEIGLARGSCGTGSEITIVEEDRPQYYERVAKVREAGGQVAMEPMDVGEMGRMALVVDPGGASDLTRSGAAMLTTGEDLPDV